MATSSQPSQVLGKRRHEDDVSEETIDKRKKLMEEIEPLIPEGLSKNQRKKTIRQMMKEKMKPEWKKLQKEKEKKRKERRRLMASTEQIPMTVCVPAIKSMFSSDASRLRIAIDLGYDELMVEKDIKMVVKQCQRCYSINRRLPKPVQLYLTGVHGKCKERFEQSVSGYKQWEIHNKEERFMEVFDKKDIVFLAAESPNIINELHEDKVYIIGGLVDHNFHKGYCYNEAIKLGVDHGRLPISEHVTLNSRTVLTINHVFEILVQYEQHKDWRKALLQAIPKRKIVQEQ